MRFLAFDELTDSMDTERLLIHAASLGGAVDRRVVRLWQQRSSLYEEYVGVFAVEGGHVVGQTYVKRLPYTFRDGVETVGAVASVGAHPAHARHGIARRLLREVHRREREVGRRYVTLWTNRSWGAHRLYEELGYRDVYPVPWALRLWPGRIPRRRRATGVGPGRTQDLPELDRLHDRLAADRLGFTRRPRRFLETGAAVREFDPVKELLVVRDGGRLRGYAVPQRSGIRSTCGELVADSEPSRRALVSEVERGALGRQVAFMQTPVTDLAGELARRGYTSMNAGWYVYMVTDLRRSWTEREARARFATADARFLCMHADRF
ncbi:MAG TPA: GNAT family N-acetyltransferase [Thermoplasmata archaeon]|nr:GNAT family N-acetyltransferase [Thermoplasmata archaeon]